MLCCIVFNLGDASALECDEDCLFAQGYTDAQGSLDYLEHFIYVVRPCEGEWDVQYHGENGYWTAVQFSSDTWYKVSQHLQDVGLYPDPDDPYIVGYATGWWSQQANPATQWGGWKGCPKLR